MLIQLASADIILASSSLSDEFVLWRTRDCSIRRPFDAARQRKYARYHDHRATAD
jgi:hypothetical protein